MSVVGQIISALMTASLVWVGAVTPVHAHTHTMDRHHATALHVVAVDFVHGDGHDELGGHDHHGADAPPHDEQAPHEHEKGIFHVHTMTFVAVEPETLALSQPLVEAAVDVPILVASLHTRSVLPADRPPRSFL